MACTAGQKNAVISVLTVVIALCAGFSIWYWGFDGQSYFYPTELPSENVTETTTAPMVETTTTTETTTETETTTTTETPVPT
jgi:hypothetical protein